MSWSTREHDMEVAMEIIDRHADDDQLELGLQEITIIQEGTLEVERSGWVIELEKTFEEQYGSRKGQTIARRVLTALLLQGEVTN